MLQKEKKRKRRHGRIRKKMGGTPERPRVTVHRSLKNIEVQAVDDTSGRTLCGLTTLRKDFSEVKASPGKVPAAEKLGQAFAEKLREAGVSKVCFDRAGYRYHGRVKAVAESLRKAGIEL